MISSIVIIALSLILLVYWFRYTCLLILRTKTSQDYSAAVVEANNLAFARVQGSLAGAGAGDLDALHESLARDYRMLTYLLEHTAGVQVGGLTIEQRMLALDFKVMQLWYGITRRVAAPRARTALKEMSLILSHFANAMGERAAASSRS